MWNTTDMTGGKPIAVWSQSISGVSAINPLFNFYDIHRRKGEVLFFCSVPDTTRNNNITFRNDAQPDADILYLPFHASAGEKLNYLRLLHTDTVVSGVVNKLDRRMFKHHSQWIACKLPCFLLLTSYIQPMVLWRPAGLVVWGPDYETRRPGFKSR
jgi:hypothetical protein